MTTPLVTSDGFPRSDIDVAQIRSVRTQIIRLKNDLKTAMKDIETQLHLHYAQKDKDPRQQLQREGENVEYIREMTEDLTISPPPLQEDLVVPFAIVNSVANASPAFTAVCK